MKMKLKLAYLWRLSSWVHFHQQSFHQHQNNSKTAPWPLAYVSLPLRVHQHHLAHLEWNLTMMTFLIPEVWESSPHMWHLSALTEEHGCQLIECLLSMYHLPIYEFHILVIHHCLVDFQHCLHIDPMKNMPCSYQCYFDNQQKLNSHNRKPLAGKTPIFKNKLKAWKLQKKIKNKQ